MTWFDVTTWKPDFFTFCQLELKIKNIKICMIRVNYVTINRMVQIY
jgi:hypothetical protein